jgi:hypothetical protein
MGVAGVAWGFHSVWGKERIHLNNVVEPAQDRGFDSAIAPEWHEAQVSGMQENKNGLKGEPLSCAGFAQSRF